MESWEKVFRDGMAPSISDSGFMALEGVLVADDHRLLQGATTSPPPLNCVLDWPCEGADAIGVAGMIGDGLKNVGDVEAYFARVCFECDQRIGAPAACRYFLNWFDETPRFDMILALLPVVRDLMAARNLTAPAADTIARRRAAAAIPF